MSHEEEQDKRGFKVEDRRRFSHSGDARPEHPDAAAPAAEPPAEPPADHRTESPAQSPAQSPAEPATHRPPLAMNFSTFVISLSTQALAYLGEIPNPIDSQVTVDLPAAKQLVDILGMLKDKTHGNLDASESELLDNILYDLRLQYVEHARGRS